MSGNAIAASRLAALGQQTSVATLDVAMRLARLSDHGYAAPLLASIAVHSAAVTKELALTAALAMSSSLSEKRRAAH